MPEIGILRHDRTAILKQFLACLAYGTVSVSITLFNKAVFAVYDFKFPASVTLLQIVISIFYIEVLSMTGHLKVARFSFTTAKMLVPMTVCWWIYVVAGVTALKYLNVPMFSVLRRSTSMVVVLLNFVIYGTVPDRSNMGALLTMVVGAVVAGMTDLTYSRIGYLWTITCVFTTAAYLIAIKWYKDRANVNDQDLMLYNNVIALPLMVCYVALGTDELQHVLSYPRIHELGFQLFLLVSISQAFLLNFCIFYCTTTNSPLATTVTGQLKDFVMTGLGMFLFGDVIFTAVNITGLAIGLSGGLWYSYLGYKKAKETTKTKDTSI